MFHPIIPHAETREELSELQGNWLEVWRILLICFFKYTMETLLTKYGMVFIYESYSLEMKMPIKTLKVLTIVNINGILNTMGFKMFLSYEIRNGSL